MKKTPLRMRKTIQMTTLKNKLFLKSNIFR